MSEIMQSIVDNHRLDLEEHLRLQLQSGRYFSFHPLSSDDICRTVEVVDGQLLAIVLLNRVKKKIEK